MFEHEGKSLEEWAREFCEKVADMENDHPLLEDEERYTLSLLEQIGYVKLKEMDHEINRIGGAVIGLILHGLTQVTIRGKLAQEMEMCFRSSDPDSAGDVSDNPDERPAENPAPPENADDEAVIAKRRGRKAKFTPEFKRLSVHRPTGNARLDALETALHDTLERLNNAKMAYHFMAIKEVRLALTDLYRAWDKPDSERIAELEAGLKDAVEKLSANRSAANSKIMPQIWGDIIVALQGSKDNNQ